MPETLAGPRAHVVDRELSRGLIKLPEHELLTNDAKDFDVHDVRSGMVCVGCQPSPDCLCSRRAGEHLT
jgi:hypothetical protein